MPIASTEKKLCATQQQLIGNTLLCNCIFFSDKEETSIFEEFHKMRPNYVIHDWSIIAWVQPPLPSKKSGRSVTLLPDFLRGGAAVHRLVYKNFPMGYIF